MFYRIHTAFQRYDHSLRALGMAGYLVSQTVCLLTGRFGLLQAHLQFAGLSFFLRIHHTAGHTDLDQIHTVLCVLCHQLPNAGGVREWEAPLSELIKWTEKVVRPTAKRAFDGVEDYQAGEWCKFCKAKATCSKRAEGMFTVEPIMHSARTGSDGAKSIQTTGALTLNDDQVGEILTRAREVASWLKDLEDYALKATLEGRHIAGWKAVEGRSSREWSGGSDKAFTQLQIRGVAETILYERKPVSVAELEKTLGKKAFAEIAEGLWTNTPGKPTLAPEGDKRRAYSPAACAFGVVNERNPA